MPLTAPTGLVCHRRSSAVAALVFTCIVATPPQGRAQSPSPIPPDRTHTIDVVAVDRSGNPVDDLTAADFSVRVENAPWRVSTVRLVSRGPGAAAEASARAGVLGNRSVESAAEPVRHVLVVVDESTMARGEEKALVKTVAAFLDRLGLDDQIALVPLPMLAGASITFHRDRPVVQAALRKVTGRAQAAAFSISADTGLPRAFEGMSSSGDSERGGDAERAVAIERERAAAAARERAQQAEPQNGVSRNTAELHRLLSALNPVPGRKVVVLFSAGLVAADQAKLDGLTAAAAETRATFYAFGMKGLPDAEVPADASALETLARRTGGRFVKLGKSPERDAAQALTELGSCYTITLEPPAGHMASAPRTVVVTTQRPGVTLRTPAWLVPGSPVVDDVVQTLSFIPPDSAATASAREPSPPAGTRNNAAEREQVRRALGRLADYIDSYRREYSTFVAEEDYRQNNYGSGRYTERNHLRSDLLLMRMESDQGWVSFRDVFEVDGKALRERDERLQKLFLTPSMDKHDRLKAIADESSRYNLGPVTRTTNSPFFPLLLFARENQPHFRFQLKDRDRVGAIDAWSLEFTEVIRPTIVLDSNGNDQPTSGRVLVDPVTGTLLEASILFAQGNRRFLLTIRFAHDERLGLWVPLEMKELYRSEGQTITDNTARYSRFRRFQVSTDTSITIPK